MAKRYNQIPYASDRYLGTCKSVSVNNVIS